MAFARVLAPLRQYRPPLRHRPALLLAGLIGPLVGAVMLAWLLVLSVIDMSDPENSYSGQAWFGVGPPLVIGIAIFVAGGRPPKRSRVARRGRLSMPRQPIYH